MEQTPAPRRGVNLRGFSAALNERIAALFGALGAFISHRPYHTIGLCCLLTGVLGLGWLRLEVENRGDRLYTVQGSRAMRDRDFVQSTFNRGTRLVTLYYTGSNLVADRGPIRDLFALHAGVEGAVGGGELQDLCLRSRAGGCAVTSVLGFWRYNASAFEADPDWVATLSNTTARDPNTFSGALEPEEAISGVTRDGSGRILRAEAFRVQWVIEERLITEDRSEYDPVADAFEEAFEAYVDAFDTCCGTAVPQTTWAFNKAIDDAFTFDGYLTAVAYVLLTTYACTVLSAENRVHSRSSLGLVAVLSVGCAVVSAFGLLLACGVPFSLVVNSVVFVMLGLGVDDAFVIMECLGQQPATLETDQRIKLGLAKAGAAITLTSATDFVAFLVGSSTIIPAIRDFCIFASVSIVFDFFYQVTLFVAFLKLDERRIEANVADCGCFCPAYCVADPTTRMCRSGRGYEANGHRQSFVRDLITRRLPDLTLTRAGKAGVVLCALALLAAGVAGLVRLELDFQYEWFVPQSAFDDTNARAALDVEHEYFETSGVTLAMYTSTADHFAARESLSELCAAAADNAWIDASSVNCWYDQWNEETGGAGANAPDAAAFYASLRAYVDGPGSRFEGNVLFTGDNSSLIATEIPMAFRVTSTAQEDLDAMAAARSTVDAFPQLGAVAYSFSFIFLEGLRVVYEETVRNVLLALGAVFVMTVLFLGDIGAASITLLTVAYVDVLLLGFIHWAGMKINMVTAINVVLSIGLVVDYSIHIAKAWVDASGDATSRSQSALEDIGVSVFQGGMTSFVALAAIVPSRTYVFNTFLRCFALIIVFGLFAGLVLLPVLLSLRGAKNPKEAANGAKPTKVLVYRRGDPAEEAATPVVNRFYKSAELQKALSSDSSEGSRSARSRGVEPRRGDLP